MFRVWKWSNWESLIYSSEYSKCFIRAFSTSRQCSTKRTHYEVLGIAREATAEDIRAAFIKKSKECHPDINRRDPNNHKQFILVNEAYSVLSKPPLRHNYDATITHSRVNEHSESQRGHPYYYRTNEHYDEQIRKIRDEYYKKRSNDTTRRHKISNTNAVAFCVFWILAGIVVHYYVVTKSAALHMKTLDERDMKIHKMFVNAKKQAEMHSAEDQVFMLLEKQNEDKARRLAAGKYK